MNRSMKPSIAFVGLIISLIGAIGSFFNIFSLKILWMVLSIIGITPALLYLGRIAYEWNTIVKTFGKRWSLEEGQLTIGNTVNVALRAKTIQEIMNFFRKSAGKKSIREIKEVGRAIGESFADDLKKELTLRGIKEIIRSGSDPRLLRNKLCLWAEYDSSTGMGLFKVDKIHISKSGLSGKISLKNSFLAYDEQSNFPVCTLLEGYLEGIVKKILSIPVSVKEIECSAVTSSDCCIFKITEQRIS